MATILVVDDDKDICDYVCGILERAGYIAIGALNGQDGLGLLDCLQCDLILLDMVMPVMDGNEFLAALQARGNGVPPIVLLSAWVDKLRAELKGTIAGQVLKPFTVQELTEAVALALGS